MRLILTAEQQRALRIALLRATHRPHVVAIQLYESSRKRIWGRKSGNLPLAASVTTPHRSRGPKRYCRSNHVPTPQPRAAPNLRPDRLIGDEQGGSWQGEGVAPEDALRAIQSLEETVAHLRRQVEQLSRRDMADQT